jgi:hypothetical protein
MGCVKNTRPAFRKELRGRWGAGREMTLGYGVLSQVEDGPAAHIGRWMRVEFDAEGAAELVVQFICDLHGSDPQALIDQLARTKNPEKLPVTEALRSALIAHPSPHLFPLEGR